MIDIVSAELGQDMGLYDTQTTKAANILSVQLGAIEYLPAFGIDLRYFLSEGAKFQNESFKAYCVQVLANNGINVATVLETKNNLFSVLDFNLSPADTSTGLIAG